MYGLHAVRAALQNPSRIALRLVIRADLWKREGETLFAGLDTVPEYQVFMAEETMPIALGGERGQDAVHQGLGLLVEPLERLRPEDLLAQLAGTQPALVLVLDQITDPRNVGALLRTAACMGVRAVVVQDRHSPQESGALAKAASGGLERVPMVRGVNLSREIERAKNLGFSAMALEASGGESLFSYEWSGLDLLVLGAEGAGIRPLVRKFCDGGLRIPQEAGKPESLNVAQAGAVATSFWRRQIYP